MIHKRDLAVCAVSTISTLALMFTVNAVELSNKPTETVEVFSIAETVQAAQNYDVIALQGKKNKVIEVATDHDDIEILANTVMAEAGNQPMVGKVAVATTILNRSEIWGKSIYSVVTQKNQYAYPYKGKVDDECYEAVEIAIKNRNLFPRKMIYFRTKHYHSFGSPYIQIGDHYFSLEEDKK